MKRKRGFTIAETLVVAVILGMLLTAVTAAIAPLFGSPDNAQAKADSLSPAGAGIYLLDRDLRESSAYGDFACTGQPPTCGDGSPNVSDSAVAIITALNSADIGAQFQLKPDNYPAWQGFIVYWQPAPGGFIYRSFVPDPQVAGNMIYPPNRTALQSMANSAVAAAEADQTAAIAMRGISTLATAVNASSSLASLHIVSTGSAGGHTNTTSFDDDIFARN